MSTRMIPLAQFRDFALLSRCPNSSALPQSLAGPNQRRSARALTAGLYATCEPHELARMANQAGTVVDLSVEGVGVALLEPYPAGAVVGLELWDAHGEAGCRVQVRVVRTALGTSGRWHHGCEVLHEGAVAQPRN
jgi:hypothetical protein